MQQGGIIKVLVVDDSAALRRLISTALERDPVISVVGTARNGNDALAQLEVLKPDLVTLDVEMPEMDGIATVTEINRKHPKLPVLMCSSMTRRGAVTTLDALAAGARDYITKPVSSTNAEDTIAHFARELTPRIKTLCRRGPAPQPSRPPTPTFPHENTILLNKRHWQPELVCIAVSTGGPNALEEVFRNFPTSFALPIVIVQHMPPVFTQLLAERLDKVGGIRFHEGAEGMRLERGHAYIAPGGHHMTVAPTAGTFVIHLNDQPPEHSCRPAADVLFRSVASACGGNALAVVLTGMGHDGEKGSAGLKAKGAHVIAQDEPTSVVWGMPGAVARAGIACEILPLPEIQSAIVRRVSTNKSLATTT